jgi:hypothetical protein
VMSNSAAPRELQQSAAPADVDLATLRKDGQGTLAIDRLALGWLSRDDITVVADEGGSYSLSPSGGATGLRLLVLPNPDGSFLTVEYLRAEGLDDFLPESGIAVHRIATGSGDCHRAEPSPEPCTGIDRSQVTMGSVAPHLDLLDGIGSTWTIDGWTVTVLGAGDAVQVEVGPTER